MARKLYKKQAKRISAWIVLLVIILPSLAVTIKKVCDYYVQSASHFFTPKKVSCTMSHIYDEKTQKDILAFVNAGTTQESLLNFDRDVFFRDLKQKFPIIKNLTWRFLISKVLEMHVIGTIPYCTINNQYVFGDKKRLFSRNFFQDDAIKNIPNLFITQSLQEKVSDNLYTFLHKIPATVWQHFAITYHDPSHIELVPHTSICPCKIITDQQTFFEERKFQALSAIFSDLSQQGFITKRILQAKSALLAFDFRINDQIIVKFYDSRGRGRTNA